MALRLARRTRTNYPYAVARVQAKRAALIPPSEYEKLLRMDVSEITRYISESAYRDDVEALAARFAGLDLLEAALTVNEERTFASIRQILDGEGGDLARLWLDRFIVEDLKTVLRGKLAGASREELLKELLLEDMESYSLFEPLLAPDVQSIDDVIQALEGRGTAGAHWAKVLGRVPAGSPPARHEDALDKAYYSDLLTAVKAFSQKGQATATAFVRREIDARNLQNAARWVHAGAEGDFSPFVIPGGRKLTVSDVMALAKASDLAAFEDGLSGHEEIHAAVREGLAAAIESRRLAPFQAAVNRYLMRDLDKLSHQNPLSILPILAYLVRKHREVVTLRALARGKAAGLSEERLRELVFA